MANGHRMAKATSQIPKFLFVKPATTEGGGGGRSANPLELQFCVSPGASLCSTSKCESPWRLETKHKHHILRISSFFILFLCEQKLQGWDVRWASHGLDTTLCRIFVVLFVSSVFPAAGAVWMSLLYRRFLLIGATWLFRGQG